jgi:fluoride exporter
VILVLLAGALGAVLRYLSSLLPSGILLVNVIGSFIAGLALASLTGEWQLVVLTGFCGGLTTFSTFSVETVQAAVDGAWRRAVLSVALNLGLGIAAAALGYTLAA